ncbi:MAG: NADH-quinone oxidoreductase subunit L [Planctomycetota bacterium]|nr:NADH-quinone oxidoreductase subunit L [Planctomycetota bacterium]
MLKPLFLVPLLPLAGFLLLVLGGRRWPRALVAVIGVGSAGLAALVASVVAGALFYMPAGQPQEFTQTLWAWMSVGGFAPQFTLHLDALSCIMMLVVAWVGFLILLYSAEFMAEDDGYGRFFAYMDFFVASMLVLVLAGDLLLLYLGWEGVGLCSYLLIGFWYRDPVNGRAARKAFIVTRVGDVAFAVGLALLFTHLGTTAIPQIAERASAQWASGSGLATAAAALLLAGAIGKSAQLPLQVWLPDAMAGPTPTSALIHAATMVTAGVYLIARMNVLFALAPAVQLAVAIIGAATLLVASCAALVQTDIKRVLAYSTISQIGYMFLALGVGAWSAAIFHFMTHAFFKSLLFLGAGVVIIALHHEHDMRKMGGLRKELPGTFWAFLIGAASLAALPLVTAGFYSKDLILARAWMAPAGGLWLWLAGLAGALLTAVYTFRMVFLVFFGPLKEKPARRPGVAIGIPLAVLAALSIVGGFIELPANLGGRPVFSNFLASALPEVAPAAIPADGWLQAVAGLVCITGIYFAYRCFLRSPALADRLAASSVGSAVRRFWFGGWGFDWLYERLFIRPYVWIARVNKGDFIDALCAAVAWAARLSHVVLSQTQTGNVRWYAMGLAIGAVVFIAVAVLL